ncbi:methyltransferase domain-containing protein, partial [bacterium]|nr:methyltransferase domain-containing protein [bacterium]
MGRQYLKSPSLLKVEIAEAEERYHELVKSLQSQSQSQSQTNAKSQLLATAKVFKGYLSSAKRRVEAGFEKFCSSKSSVFQSHQDLSNVGGCQPQATAAYESSRSSYLNLGCGSCFHADWTNVDSRAVSQDVITYDLRQGIPFPDDSFTVVYHSHLLEHLPKSAAEPFLRECYRVLEPGGILRVVVPDLEQIARLYLTALEKASQGDRQAAANYDWMLLEMYDQ